MNHKCVYCGADAMFQFKNGKWCCRESKNKCPKNRNTVKEYALKEWMNLKDQNIFCKKYKPIEMRKQIDVTSLELCSYGCGEQVKFLLSNGRGCCSKKYYLCKAVKQRISQGVKSSIIKNGKSSRLGRVPWNKNLTRYTDKRIFEKGERLSKRYENKELIPSGLGRIQTEETKQKISKSRLLYLSQHPEQVPYRLNHSSKISYPEKYFKLLFSIEKIPLLFHKQVGLYELDFYNEVKKKYVEIDGESHYVDKKTIEIDKRRTVFLDGMGWRGMRIRWSTYKKFTKEEKKKLIYEIRRFIE